MLHLIWVPSFVLGSTVAAGSASLGAGDIAALMGGAAALVSAITGLVVALRRKDAPVIVVSPEQLENVDVSELAKARKRKQR